MSSRLVYGIALWVLGCFAAGHMTAQSSILSERIANYDIEVDFDPVTKTLDGNQKITWRNATDDTVSTLQFHLYYNAFKNNQSTFYKETSPDGLLKSIRNEDCHWGYSQIDFIQINGGNEIMDNLHFIQPDDENDHDQTVAELLLDDAVLPGESIVINMKWSAKIPRIKVRTGFNKDFYFFAQWFPKLGRYEAASACNEQKSQWKCHQYHSSGEYYADFGNYSVLITAPEDFVVAASGQLVESSNQDGKTSHRYQIDDVIDFAWAASPHFTVQKSDWNGVELSLITYPGHEHCGVRFFGAVKNALDYLDEHLGEYPYRTLTIIDPPIHGIFTGGMEYPTLITSLSFCFLPEGVMTTETLTVHEFIHQYFMQMVATNEQEEPWLDEGITTYYEGRIMDHYYGGTASTINWLGMTVGNTEYNRWEYFAMDNPKIADNTRKSREFVHGGYGPISYNKTAVWLKTLEGLVGIDNMDLIMKTYFDRWKFNHPCAGDFEDVVNEVVRSLNDPVFGQNMTWFFDQVLRSSNECDYALASIHNFSMSDWEGYTSDNSDCIANSGMVSDSIHSTVIVHRLGEIKMPVEIAISFDDGHTEMVLWDGEERSASFDFTGHRLITKAIIDPDRKIYIDKNFINNSLMVDQDQVGIKFYFTHFMEKFQSLMLGMSIFI